MSHATPHPEGQPPRHAGAGPAGWVVMAGLVAATAALFAPALAERGVEYAAASRSGLVDPMVTGSLSAAPSRYVIHRSVLQSGEPCLIFADGTRRGSC